MFAHRRMKLVLVPVWLETALKAHGLPLDSALHLDKLVSILSKRDLNLYREVQSSLSQILPPGVFESFGAFEDDVPVAGEMGVGELSEEQVEYQRERKRLYLYGDLLSVGDAELDPEFAVHPMGGDHIVLTVKKEKGSKKNLMESLLAAVHAHLGITGVARMPLFRRYLQAL